MNTTRKFEKIDSSKFTELKEMNSVIGGVGPRHKDLTTHNYNGGLQDDVQKYTYNLDAAHLCGPDAAAQPK